MEKTLGQITIKHKAEIFFHRSEVQMFRQENQFRKTALTQPAVEPMQHRRLPFGGFRIDADFIEVQKLTEAQRKYFERQRPTAKGGGKLAAQ